MKKVFPIRRFLPGELDTEIDRASLHCYERIWDAKTIAVCGAIHQKYDQTIPNAAFCDLPKCTFLDYLVQHQGMLLFGSNDSELEELEPIVISQNLVGWDTPRHLAFTTGIEAIYQAILDRRRLEMRGLGGQSTIVLPFGNAAAGATRFYFGLDHRIVADAPWRAGTVYAFRRSDFADDFCSRPFLSRIPIRPTLRINVRPQDWPLLHRVAGVDHAAQAERQWDTLSGYPWIDDTEIHPGLWKRPLANVVRSCIEERFAEPASLELLGKEIGCSPFTTLRLFRSVYGQSPHEYQTQVRISKAKQMLRRGQPIGVVAQDAGFYDQTHFNRHFREVVAMTPGEYVRVQESPIRPD